jgi:hypothetical protein
MYFTGTLMAIERRSEEGPVEVLAGGYPYVDSGT